MRIPQGACLCGSGRLYEACCGPYHTGEQLPENALILMRSRYVAYALNLPDYIIKTTHPASPHYQHNLFAWKRGISKFSQSNSFDKLEIVDFQEQEGLAVVIFIAHLSQGEQDHTCCEKSYFEKIQERWFYKWGQLIEGHEHHFTIHRPLKLVSLAYYGEPILCKKTAPVSHVTDDIRTLVAEMTETMDACGGLGLAAPQVPHSLQLFIIRKPVEVQDKIEAGELCVFINPEISEPSVETWTTSEGCLSIPSIHGDVERPKSIRVEYTNLEGQRFKQQFCGWEARVILHENDHINGVLFIDRLAEPQRQVVEPLLRCLKQRIRDALDTHNL